MIIYLYGTSSHSQYWMLSRHSYIAGLINSITSPPPRPVVYEICSDGHLIIHQCNTSLCKSPLFLLNILLKQDCVFLFRLLSNKKIYFEHLSACRKYGNLLLLSCLEDSEFQCCFMLRMLLCSDTAVDTLKKYN